MVHVSFVRGEVPEKDDRRERLVQVVDICKEGGTVDGTAKLQQCVALAADVFALDKGELGQVVDLCHTIETGDSAPVCQQPWRVPFALRPELTKMINDMLGAKVIQESSSPWASPIVLVRKKDGSLRFCADYRRLNAVTRKDVYPLPRIDDLLDQLGGKKVFSTLDARTGYWQIRMEESTWEKTVVYTDHAPLKAMLKAKHPSGKLARWAGIILELDLDIQYRPGRKNANADALSRCTLERVEDSQTVGVVTQVSEVDCESLGVGAEELVKLQVEDNQLSQLRQYLQDGELPEDGRQAKRLVLEKERFVILDEVLYYVDPGGQHRLRIAVPKKLRGDLDQGDACRPIWWTLFRSRAVQSIGTALLVGRYVW